MSQIFLNRQRFSVRSLTQVLDKVNHFRMRATIRKSELNNLKIQSCFPGFDLLRHVTNERARVEGLPCPFLKIEKMYPDFVKKLLCLCASMG